MDQIDARHPEGGNWLFLIEPELEGAGSHRGKHTPTGRNNHVINFQHNVVEPGRTLIHEISHGFGLCHPISVPPGYGCNDPHFPRADDFMGPQVAIRVTPQNGDSMMGEAYEIVSGETAEGTILNFEIMSYALPSWISLYTYNKGMRGASNGALVAPASLEGGG